MTGKNIFREDLYDKRHKNRLYILILQLSFCFNLHSASIELLKMATVTTILKQVLNGLVLVVFQVNEHERAPEPGDSKERQEF